MATGLGRSIWVGVKADTKNFERGMRGATSTVDKFKARLKVAAVAGAAAFGAYAVSAVKAAAEDQAAQIQLAKTLRNTTKASNEVIASTEKWITKQQFATGISDNDFRKALQRLTRSTKDVTEAQKLATLATDISASTGKDYVTVAMALAKANDGQFTALKKLGITMGDNAQNAADLASANGKLLKLQDDLTYAQENFGTSSEEYNKALQKVTDQQAEVNAITALGVDWVGELSTEFGGSASAAAQTYAGQLKIVSEKFGELTEDIGVILMPAFAKLLDFISNSVMPKLQAMANGFSGKPDSISNKLKQVGRDLGYAPDSGAYNLGKSLRDVADSMGRLISVATGSGTSNATSNLQKIADALESVANGIDAISNSWNNPAFKAYRKALGWTLNPGKTVANLLPGRATGGNVMAGKTYMVGENGPELFTSAGGGTITPNQRLRAGGGGQTINVTMNGIVDGESARRSIENLLQKSARRTGAVSFSGVNL